MTSSQKRYLTSFGASKATNLLEAWIATQRVPLRVELEKAVTERRRDLHGGGAALERLEQGSLFVNQQLGFPETIYKQDMRDLQLNFFLNLGGHLVMRQLTNLNFGALRRDQRQHVTSRFAFRG